MSKKYSIIENIVLIAIFCLSFVIGHGIFKQINTLFSYSYICFLLLIVCLVTLIFLSQKTGTKLLNKYVLITFGVLLVLYLFTLFIPTGVNYSSFVVDGHTFKVATDIGSRFVSLEYFFVLEVVLYIALVIFPKIKYFKLDCFIAKWAFVAFLAFLIVASLIKEWSIYKEFFTGAGIVKTEIKSITGNGNEFGMFLLVGMILMALDEIKRPRFYNLLLSCLFYVFILFTLSDTCMILGAFLLLLCFITRIIYFSMHLKQSKASIVHFVLGIVIVIALTLLFCFGIASNKVPILSKLMDSFFQLFKKGDFKTLRIRFEIQSAYLKILTSDAKNFIFGIGNNLSLFAYGDGTGLGSHNSFIQMWVDGGIFFLIFALLLIAFVIFVIVRMFKNKNYRMGIYFSGVMLVICVHSLFEASFKLGLSIQSLAIITLVICPVINYYSNYRAGKLTLNEKNI